MLTPENLDRLEAAARKQSGLEFGTGIFVMPGELLELIAYSRHHLFLVDLATQRIEPVLDLSTNRSTAHMNTTSFSTGQPSQAFPPTIEAVVSDWFEVAASFDSREALPRSMAVSAVTAEGIVLPQLTMNSIEIELPGGLVAPFDGPMQSVLPIGFPCRWRINKPATVDPVTYVVFGTGVTATAQD